MSNGNLTHQKCTIKSLSVGKFWKYARYKLISCKYTFKRVLDIVHVRYALLNVYNLDVTMFKISTDGLLEAKFMGWAGLSQTNSLG